MHNVKDYESPVFIAYYLGVSALKGSFDFSENEFGVPPIMSTAPARILESQWGFRKHVHQARLDR
jgi:hypothetical protein